MVKFFKGRKKKDYFWKFKKNRCHSWIGHITRHNEFVVNILEGVISGKKAMGRPRLQYLKQVARSIGADSYTTMKRIACNIQMESCQPNKRLKKKKKKEKKKKKKKKKRKKRRKKKKKPPMCGGLLNVTLRRNISASNKCCSFMHVFICTLCISCQEVVFLKLPASRIWRLWYGRNLRVFRWLLFWPSSGCKF